jgi:RNA polymerase sigma-70 factor (ECF subfamily)
VHSHLEAQLDRLVNYAQCLSKDRDYARDLAQSCIVKALAARNVPSDERAYRTWLFRILRNTFLDNLRKQSTDDKIRREIQENYATDGNNPQQLCVYTIEQRKINILSVHQGLEKLSDGQREILILIDMVGFSYRETADLLELPIGTVMSRISRSRNALLRAMDEVAIGPVSVVAMGKDR